MKNELPRFRSIDPATIEPAIQSLLEDSRAEVREVLERVGSDGASWDQLVAHLEDIDDRLEKAWAPISHLNAVLSSDDLRQAHDACLPMLAEYATEMGQSRPLFDAYRSLEGEAGLDRAQQKVVTNALRDFRLAGVDLDDEPKARFAEIRQRLSVLSSEFSNRVLDATDAWWLGVTREELDGLPEVNLELAKAAAETRDVDGYVVTLEMPSYFGVMDHCRNRALRKQIYRAYVARASEVGPHAGEYDNTETMREIVLLRQEMAALLGFANYAELSVATKMAASGEEVQTFLDDLLARCLPVARSDIAELRDAAGDFGIDEVEPWDVRFLTERVREARYSVSQEALRPYFPIDRVLAGMFEIVKRLFDVDVVAADAPDTWHDDVRFYSVERDGETIAHFYLDAFARSAKRSGAWMADCVVRREWGNDRQLPVAFLTCNFAPGVGDRPALLTHDEVTTLFHEFGHGLHHMLTRQKYAAVSGINGVAWDAVELPSQFLENWCWQRESIPLISGHFETGEALPADMLDRLLAAKNFQSGWLMVRQLEFGLYDMAVHTDPDPSNVDFAAILMRVKEKTNLLAPIAEDRFPWSFGHIFAGGYAAGYYSYLWAEVLSADAFGAFEETDVFDVATGRRFLNHVLEVGGSEEPQDFFRAFRGRDASPDALLRHTGISG